MLAPVIWLCLYVAGGLTVLFFSFRLFGKVPDPAIHNGDDFVAAVVAYLVLFALWPVAMLIPIAIYLYRLANAPKHKLMVYDPEYTAKLERDLAELKRITEEHK